MFKEMPKTSRKDFVDHDNIHPKQGEDGMADVAHKQVRCKKCGNEYTCTPTQDYYADTDETDENGVFIDGVCEPCLLTGAGFEPIPNHGYDGSKPVIIGRTPNPN